LATEWQVVAMLLNVFGEDDWPRRMARKKESYGTLEEHSRTDRTKRYISSIQPWNAAVVNKQLTVSSQAGRVWTLLIVCKLNLEDRVVR